MTRFKNKKGQGLVEYLIIMSLMAVATMAIMRVLSQTVEVKFARVTQALQGEKAKTNIPLPKIESSHVKKKDMSDFFQGSVTQGDSEKSDGE